MIYEGKNELTNYLITANKNRHNDFSRPVLSEPVVVISDHI
jgi:hypothetical protein